MLVYYVYYTRSSSLKGSPHSGQNFGGCSGSAGTQPHLSHLYFLGAAGFDLPHSAQNLPVLVAPHSHVQLEGAGAAGASPSLLLPQLAQNLPVFD